MLRSTARLSVFNLAAAAAWIASASTALAHPGHGVTPDDSAAHYLLEPTHGLGAFLLLITLAACGSMTRSRVTTRRRRA